MCTGKAAGPTGLCLGINASPSWRQFDNCVESLYIHIHIQMPPHLQTDDDEGTAAPLDPAQSGGSAQQAAGFLQQAVRDEATKEQRLQRELSPEQYSLWKEKQMKAQRVSQLQLLGDMLLQWLAGCLPQRWATCSCSVA